MKLFTVDMVKPLRDKLNMSQEDFAREIGCGVRAVSHWETGKVQKIHRSLRNAMIALKNYHEAKK
jgi:DNA-binding transcriptional regulator YiaG